MTGNNLKVSIGKSYKLMQKRLYQEIGFARRKKHHFVKYGKMGFSSPIYLKLAK
jgi:hypothetical protein